MTYRPAFSLIFAIALVASLALKLPGIATQSTTSDVGVPTEVARVLEQRNFQVSRLAPDDDLAAISGISGTCRVTIASVSPQGWHRSLIAQMAAGGQLSYLFDGGIYAEQPVFKTKLSYYWTRLNRYFGRTVRPHPVLAVIAGPACVSVPLQPLAALHP